MATEIFKSFGSLQSELDQAKSYLKGVDENIKRLIGRDPSELFPTQSAPPVKRNYPKEEPVRSNRPQAVSSRIGNYENHDPGKRRLSVFQRLDGPTEENAWVDPSKSLISKVIVTPREVPSRQEVLASRRTDEKSKARNKRMFGALLGTLQKFQQEESKLKSKVQKRAQVEKRIEDLEIKEKAEIRKERQELFFNRRKKLVEIKIIEIKMMRMREFATWEQRIKPRSHYILTKTKPHVQFLPRRLNDASKELLVTSKTDVEKIIEDRKQEVLAELQRIEERILTNFELRNFKEEGSIRNDKEDKHEDNETMNDAKEDNFANEECEAEIDDIIHKATNEVQEEDRNVPENNDLLKTCKEDVEEMDTTEAPASNSYDEEMTVNEKRPSKYDDSLSKTEESD